MDSIIIDPEMLSDPPVFRGTRVPVEIMLGCLASVGRFFVENTTPVEGKDNQLN